MQNQPTQQVTTPKLPVPDGIQDAQIWGHNLLKMIHTVASSDANEDELRASLFSLSRLAQSVMGDLDEGVEELHSRASEQGSSSAGHQFESDQRPRQQFADHAAVLKIATESDSPPASKDKSDRSALLALEEPINLARGQAWTMYMAQEQDGKTDPMVHAGQALFRTMDDLFNVWDAAVHKS